MQLRFNQTFGTTHVCDLKTRQSVILTICAMKITTTKINTNNHQPEKWQLIKKFMRARNVLNSIFDQFENELNERRIHQTNQQKSNMQHHR